MNMAQTAENILEQISSKDTKLGDLRTIAKAIKKNHQLAMELWNAKYFFARQLAILIMDKKQLTEEVIDHLIGDINQHEEKEKLQLTDWLMANQLTKDKEIIALIDSWRNSPSSLKRRIFWYYQDRLRWTGQIPPSNTEELVSKFETEISKEQPEVQWAMNLNEG